MTRHILLWIALVLLLTASPAGAVAFGQTDTFQVAAEDTMGWAGGDVIPPVRMADGGPLGAGDAYLHLHTEEFHLGSRNSDQWSGDYLAAGVTAIEMDLNAMGPDDVAVRVLLFGPGGEWASADLTPLVTGGGWAHQTFSLAPADLIYVIGGTGVLNDTLGAVEKLLVRNDRAVPTLPGEHPPHITASMGIDNITAVPEPATAALVAAGLGAAALGRRRR